MTGGGRCDQSGGAFEEWEMRVALNGYVERFAYIVG